ASRTLRRELDHLRKIRDRGVEPLGGRSAIVRRSRCSPGCAVGRSAIAIGFRIIRRSLDLLGEFLDRLVELLCFNELSALCRWSSASPRPRPGFFAVTAGARTKADNRIAERSVVRVFIIS